MIFDRFGFLQFFLRLSHWTFSTNWLFVLRYSPCRQYRKRTRFRGVHFAEKWVIFFTSFGANINPERSTFSSKCSIRGSFNELHWTHVKWHGSKVQQLSSLDRQLVIRYDSYCMIFSKKNSGDITCPLYCNLYWLWHGHLKNISKLPCSGSQVFSSKYN